MPAHQGGNARDNLPGVAGTMPICMAAGPSALSPERVNETLRCCSEIRPLLRRIALPINERLGRRLACCAVGTWQGAGVDPGQHRRNTGSLQAMFVDPQLCAGGPPCTLPPVQASASNETVAR